MSYLVLHMDKFKAEAVRGIQCHNNRERESRSNPDIVYERSGQNYELHENAASNYVEAIQNRIDDLLLVKAVRKDAVRMCGLIVSSDTAFFEGLTDKEKRRFFEESKAYLTDFVGKENVISAMVHMDEKTPHMHFLHVPVTTDGRLNANKIYTRESLRKLQSDLPAYLQNKGFEIQRGVEQEQGAAKKHLNTREYKQQQEELARLKKVEASLKQKNQDMEDALELKHEQEKELQKQLQEYEKQAHDAEISLKYTAEMPEASMFNFKSAMEKAKHVIELQHQALAVQKKHKEQAVYLERENKSMRQKIDELESSKQRLFDDAVSKLRAMRKCMEGMQASFDTFKPFLEQPEITALHKSFCARQEQEQKREEERQREVAIQKAAEQKAQLEAERALSAQRQSMCRMR